MKRIISSVLVLIMAAFALPVSAAADPFTDTQSHWARYYISDCYKDGILKGTGATTFSPDAPMSVAEIVTIAVRLSGNGANLSQSGTNWYDSAVNKAKQLGIITDGQFDSYTRSATRSEVAGMLAAAKPESEYQPINSVPALPDVDANTPYSDAIFKLYRAGILTGSDAMGTFYPGNNITRGEVATLIFRINEKNARQEFSFFEPLSDLTVRTTDKRVNIGGVFSYGVVEIGGKYFVIPELLEVSHKYTTVKVEFTRDDTDCVLNLRAKSAAEAETAYTVDYSFAMPSGIVMGTAQPYKGEFYFNGARFNGAVYTIDGRMPMLSLEALGAKAEGNDFAIVVDKYPSSIVKEADLSGNALWNVQRSTPKESVRAIHDYMVNSLMYSPFVSAPSNMSQAQIDAAYESYCQIDDSYQFDNNLTLASGYAICEDYANLFLEMCLRSGIPCIKVEGSANSMGELGGHAWNMVYIDGKWQYVDVTWDDPVGSKQTLRHSYFLVDANMMAKTHLWDEFPMPEKYDPAWEQLDPNNITDADMWRKCLVAQMMMGKETIKLRTTKGGAYGGTVCIYNYDTGFYHMSGSSSGSTYTFNVKYW